MIDSIQDLFEQRELYQQLLKKVASLEALLEAKEKEQVQVSTEDVGEADDLTKIKGIGQVTNGKLKEHGIHSFSQIAALTDEDIAKLEEELNIFSGKIKREDWVGQARKM